GNLWFTESGQPAEPAPAGQVRESARVGRISPQGTLTEFALPAGSESASIAVGADGNLWVTAQGIGALVRVTPAGGVTPLFLGIFGVGTGLITRPDGNLWFTELDGIGQVRPPRQ